MRKLGFAEMNAFVAIAERSSFAKAALHLGISRSALSETIRGLEEKLGVRLLNRTTRSVALTQVGERLLAELRPALASFESAVESINVFRDKPAGHLRLTVPASPDYLRRHARPKVPADLQAHNCIRRRFASGALAPWAFERRGKSL